MIASRIDRLPEGRYLWSLVGLISLGGWSEFYELFLTAYIAPGLTRSGLLVSTTKGFFGFEGLGAFVAATFAGLFVGTLFLGFLSDRFGRKAVFLAAMLWYSGAAAAMACQATAQGLLIWRFIAGIGIGVELVTIDAYIAEIVPARMRGRAFALNQSVTFAVVPLVALLSWRLVPLAPFGIAGWRWVVLIGSVGGAAVVLVFRRIVPESPRWLAQKGRLPEAERIVERMEGHLGPARAGPSSSASTALHQPGAPGGIRDAGSALHARALWRPPLRGRLIVLAIFNACQVIGYYGFANWVPTLLLAKGITVTSSLFYSFVIAVANPVGPLLAMSIADRVERKWLIVGAAFAIIATGTGFSLLSAPAWLVAFGILQTLSNGTLSFAYHAYQTEIFPVSIRSRASGIAYSASRLAAIFSGFLVAFFLRKFGAVGVFAMITTAMILVMLVVGLFGPSIRSLAEDDRVGGQGANLLTRHPSP